MTNPKFWQEPFDPSATFIVAGWLPGFTHKGTTPKRGEIFDKTGVREDRLRSLYESRWIRMAAPGEAPSPAPQLDMSSVTAPSHSGGRGKRGKAA